jgi:O-antigen/teichoic acid export membrane protein
MTRASSSFVGRTALVTASQSVVKLSDLLVAIVLVRLLSPAEWSAIVLVLSFYAAALGLAAMGLPQGIVFFFGHLPVEERRRFVVQTTGLLAVMGAIAGGAILTLGLVLDLSAYSVNSLLPWLALAVVLEIPTLGAPELLIAAERIGWSAAFSTGVALLRVALITGPIAAGRGIQGAVIGLLGYAVARLLAYSFVVRRVTRPGVIRADRDSIKTQIVYSAPLGISNLAYALHGNIGKWLVAALDSANLGAYAIAATQVPLVPILGYATGAALATRLVDAFRHGRLEEARSFWLAATSRTSMVVVPVTIAIVLGAPQLLRLLFGDQYPAAVLPFQVASLVLLHRVADHGLMLRAAGDTRSLWRVSWLLLGLNAVLGAVLTFRFGMLGMAVATVGANLVAWLYMLSRIAGALGCGLRSAFPWRLYGRVLLVAILAAWVAAWVSRFGPDHQIGQLGLRWAVFAGLFVGAVQAFRLTRAVPAMPAGRTEFHPPAVAESEAL